MKKKSHFDSFWSALFLESHFCGWSRLRHGNERLRSFSDDSPFLILGGDFFIRSYQKMRSVVYLQRLNIEQRGDCP